MSENEEIGSCYRKVIEALEKKITRLESDLEAFHVQACEIGIATIKGTTVPEHK